MRFAQCSSLLDRYRILCRVFSDVVLILLSLSPFLIVPKLLENASIRNRPYLDKPARGLIFYSANDSAIQYNGRWTWIAKTETMSGAFSGASIDIVIENATSIYLSFSGVQEDSTDASKSSDINAGRDITRNVSKHGVDEQATIATAPSILVKFNGESHLLPSPVSSSFFKLDVGDWPPERYHHTVIQLLDSMSTVQFKGVWLSHNATLVKPTQLKLATKIANPNLAYNGSHHADMKRIIEVVDDTRATVSLPEDESTPEVPSIAAELATWRYVLGDLLDVNTVNIVSPEVASNEKRDQAPVDNGSIRQLYFRSGPIETSLYDRPWKFSSYSPLAVVVAIAHIESLIPSDIARKEVVHGDLSDHFVDHYVDFIKSVRRTHHQTSAHDSPGQTHFADGYTYNSGPPTTPIFILRPFTGEMEYESQLVVQRLQRDGDFAVFWVDTTGWLDDQSDDPNASKEDFNPSLQIGQGTPSRSLTAFAHWKIASFLHTHMCVYLALDTTLCPFSHHDSYIGKTYLPQNARFEMGLEDSKREKLFEKFWRLV